MSDGRQRLAKIMGRRGLCSRREAERLIEAGEVIVDGEVISQQGFKCREDADIRIAGRGQRWMDKRHSVILNKPRHVVSTQPEGSQIPAWTLISADNAVAGSDPELVASISAKPQMLNVAGRLDRESRGLLVLTTDGRVVRVITGSTALPKTYLVEVDGPIGDEQLRILNGRMKLDGKPLKAMQVERLDDHHLRFVLREGKKHQIRRACGQCDLIVRDLLREAVGPWQLGDLPEGQWRPVTGDALAELEAFRG